MAWKTMRQLAYGLLAVVLLMAACAPRGRLTPTPAAGVEIDVAYEGPVGMLAFIRDGELRLARAEPGGVQERLLMEGAELSEPRFSASGAWVAYRAGDEVSIVATDDSGVSAGRLGPLGRPAAFVWSPTRDLLAYVGADGNVGLFDPLTGREELIGAGNGAVKLAWRPDGRKLYVEREERGQGEHLVGQGVWQLDLASGCEQALYAPYQADAGGPVAHLADVSPDGRWLAFWQSPMVSPSLLADGADLHLLQLDSGQVERLGVMLAYRDWLSWTSDGTALAFVEGGGREAWRNKRISFHVLKPSAPISLPVSITHQREDARSGAYGPSLGPVAPAWSPDGLRLASCHLHFVGDAARPQASLIMVDQLGDATGEVESTAVPPRVKEGLFNGSPWFSADRRYLLFVRHLAQGDTAGVWAYNFEQAPYPVVADIDRPPDYYGHFDWSLVLDWQEASPVVPR